jgi:hypothetical protein
MPFIINQKPGTATQCKTKDSSCHRQSSVRALSGIRAAQSSVFCVVFITLHEEGIYCLYNFVPNNFINIVKNLELPHNVKLKTQVVTDRIPSVL